MVSSNCIQEAKKDLTPKSSILKILSITCEWEPLSHIVTYSNMRFRDTKYTTHDRKQQSIQREYLFHRETHIHFLSFLLYQPLSNGLLVAWGDTHSFFVAIIVLAFFIWSFGCLRKHTLFHSCYSFINIFHMVFWWLDYSLCMRTTHIIYCFKCYFPTL